MPYHRTGSAFHTRHQPLTAQSNVCWRIHRGQSTRLVAIAICCFAAAATASVIFAADETASAHGSNIESDAVKENRIDEGVRYLASDELEGRGLGTKGIDLAAQYVAAQFKTIGLKTDVCDGSPFQAFKVTIGSKLGPKEDNRLTLDAPNGSAANGQETGLAAIKDKDLVLGTEFTPLAIGGTAEFDLPVIFAGYGISAKEENYDDFAGIDVKEKAVIILRHEPQNSNPHGAFEGTKDSRHAPIARKISNAYQHGAAAVVLVTGEFEIQRRVAEATKRFQRTLDAVAKANDELKEIQNPTLDDLDARRKKIDVLLEQARAASQRIAAEYDPLFAFDRGGDATESRRFAVIHCRRAAIEPMIEAALGTPLGELERQIDKDLKPHSRELAGWRIRGETNVERVEAPVKNVVAVLEGEGPKSDETIVVGAHYDHLGRGDSGSLSPGSKEIHNGADDNGSGTIALVEVARRLAARDQKLPRRVVFIAFTGEERGLLGSGYYVHNPLFPIEKTIAMLNMDMVGRMTDDKLVIYGTSTAVEFDELVDRVNQRHGFNIKREAGGFGPSDHSSFYALKIPVLHFFTGLHNDYHRPSDDANKLNVPGIRRVSEMVAETAAAIAEAENPPQYQQAAREALRSGSQPMGDRPYFGSIPNLSGGDVEGYAIQGVGKDSPAEKGGLQAGDVIVRLGESKIGSLADFDSALRNHKAGDKASVVVRRDGKEVTLDVTLDSPR